METLLEVAPRSAGSDVVEPQVEFPGDPMDPHFQSDCAITSACVQNTSICYTTA